MPMQKFRVGPSKHYRQGRFYEEGEVVTIDTDKEKPAPDWVKLIVRPKVELVAQEEVVEDTGEPEEPKKVDEPQGVFPDPKTEKSPEPKLYGKPTEPAPAPAPKATPKAAEKKGEARPADKDVL